MDLKSFLNPVREFRYCDILKRMYGLGWKGETVMRILVAEDEEDLRRLLEIGLTGAGYQVLTAENGARAWGILNEGHLPVDLAILDVMMPELDGISLLKRIRASSTIPVIFLTARDEEPDKVAGLGLGADDYMVKPFSMSELVARVGAQLRRCCQYSSGGNGVSGILRCGQLTLDRNACEVRVEGRLVELNAKEYHLLGFFMENPGRVFTRKQLYNAVWEDTSYYDDNTVMVHISHLRNKIEKDPQNPEYLRTIRGLGYKLQKGRESC